MTEIEKLRKEFNDRLDALEKKESEPKFQVGKKYCDPTFPKRLFCITKLINSEKCSGFGFDWQGNWFVDSNSLDLKNAVLIKDKIWEKALVEEAKKRGFKEGVCFNSPPYTNADYERNQVIEDCEFSYGYDKLTVRKTSKNTGGIIYRGGKWAEIIKDETIKIGTYPVNFYDGYTKIDGNLFTKDFWESAKKISEHSKAKIMIGCSKQFDVSLETINKILSNL